ncbi:MAG TPA: tetratricopeptide repeat protein [Candidatus Brocadiia bacterium]|nr:tetratricopeptide repeat protein [Candidatus Brocadiia bacterium]
MSKTYHEFQSLDAERKPKGPLTNGNGVSGADDEDAPAPGGGLVRATAIAIIVVALVTVAVVFVAPQYLVKQGGLRAVERPPAGRRPPAAQPAEPEAGTAAAKPAVPDSKPADREPVFDVIEVSVSPSGDSLGAKPAGAAATQPVAVTAVEIVGAPAAAEALEKPPATPEGAKPAEGAVATARLTDASAEMNVTRETGPGARTGKPGEESPPKSGEAPMSDFARAVSLQAAGQDDEAAIYYNKALVKNPSHASALNNLGVIYQRMNDYNKAIETYRKAIAAEPNNYRCYNNLATCLIALGKHAEATPPLERSLQLEPDNCSALLNMGVAYTGLRNYALAEKYLLSALEKHPGDLRVVYNLANMYRRKPDSDKARMYFRLFLDRSNGRNPAQEKMVRDILSRMGEGR